MPPLFILFFVAILIFSVIIHEISHGYVAMALGDDTAKRLGRLTLNPIKHIDPIGSIFLPLILALAGAPVFGWAKPVPYNPFNLRQPKRDSGFIALAGPVSNLIVAAVFAMLARIMASSPSLFFSGEFFALINIIIQVNIALAIFNLLPIPPLDGSGVLFSLLPKRLNSVARFLGLYGIIILVAIVFFGASFISPVIFYLHKLLVGSSAAAIFGL